MQRIGDTIGKVVYLGFLIADTGVKHAFFSFV